MHIFGMPPRGGNELSLYNSMGLFAGEYGTDVKNAVKKNLLRIVNYFISFTIFMTRNTLITSL